MLTTNVPQRPSWFVRRGWCRGAHACTDDGKPCELIDPMATKCDIVGALQLSRNSGWPMTPDAVQRIDAHLPAPARTGQLTEWNDRQHSMWSVIEVLERCEL